MKTADAWARGAANRGRELKVFDWDKAATLIRERAAKKASAGLRGDWEGTGGAILEGGRPLLSKKASYTYLASTWATPELELDDDGVLIPCFRMESECPGWDAAKDKSDWDADTRWPPSALLILQENTPK